MAEERREAKAKEKRKYKKEKLRKQYHSPLQQKE